MLGIIGKCCIFLWSFVKLHWSYKVQLIIPEQIGNVSFHILSPINPQKVNFLLVSSSTSCPFLMCPCWTEHWPGLSEIALLKKHARRMHIIAEMCQRYLAVVLCHFGSPTRFISLFFQMYWFPCRDGSDFGWIINLAGASQQTGYICEKLHVFTLLTPI